jgi:hypothetical protein
MCPHRRLAFFSSNERVLLMKRGDEDLFNTPQEGTLFSPPLREISTFTKFIHKKQEMNF